MSSGRWDVYLLFLDGPLQFREVIVAQGPVVRIGANPGPDGLKLEGYRGLDDRAAVITAYDGSNVHVAPIEPNQVRVAAHANVRWSEIAPARGPTWLPEGAVVHLGPPDRGATFEFQKVAPLGAWKGHTIVSEAAQADGALHRTEVRAVDPWKRIPWWFLPGVATIFAGFVATLALFVFLGQQRAVARLGPQVEGTERPRWESALDEKTNAVLISEAENGFDAFVLRWNVTAAGDPSLENRKFWDEKLIESITRSEQVVARGWKSWGVFERAHDDYAYVLGQLREEDLPDAFAAIPFQESGYTASARSDACALGWWQFMPEVAVRAGAEVRNCTFRNGSTLWSPTLKAVPMNALERADYIDHTSHTCRIESCEVDERPNLEISTRAAIRLLREAWENEEVRQSGAAVQMVIASHNAGLDDAPYRNGQISTTQLLPAYRLHLKKTGKQRAPDFIGANLTCDKASKLNPNDPVNGCGSVLVAQTQHYVGWVLAYQFLAACYYGTNYGTEEVFKRYGAFARGDYCSRFDIKTPEEVRRGAFGR